MKQKLARCFGRRRFLSGASFFDSVPATLRGPPRRTMGGCAFRECSGRHSCEPVCGHTFRSHFRFDIRSGKTFCCNTTVTSLAVVVHPSCAMTPQPLADDQVVTVVDDLVTEQITTTNKTSSSSSSSKNAPLLSKFAQAHMAKLGWTPGSGLGKRRDGRSTHIQVRKREEGLGLGASTVAAVATTDEWWKDSLGHALAHLNHQHSTDSNGKKKKKKSKKTSSSQTDPSRRVTDEELFQATGGARFGMRAQRRAEGKWRRTESTESMTTPSVTTTTEDTTSKDSSAVDDAKVTTKTISKKSEKSKRKRDGDDDDDDKEAAERETSSSKKEKKQRKEKKEKKQKKNKGSPE